MESNTPTLEDDRRRLLAETKKLTLQPVHNDTAPEAISDTEVTARHLTSPAVGNVANDTEQNAAPIRPSKSALGSDTSPSPRRSAIRYISTSVAIVTVLGGIIIVATVFLVQ